MINISLTDIVVRIFPSELFHDGGPYHTETSPLICSVNQWTGFYMIGASVMKELITCATAIL